MNKYLSNITDTIKKKKFYNLGFLGDSITSTEWVHPNWRETIRYTLEEELEKTDLGWQPPSWYIRTINAGFNGATTQDMLSLLDQGLFVHNPNIIIFINTINDMDLGLTKEQHATNTRKILDLLTNNADHIVMCTANSTLSEEYNKKYDQFIKPMRKIISGYNLDFIDLFELTAKIDKSDMFTFISEDGNPEMGIEPGAIDFAHPNTLGNAYIAKILLKEIFDIEFNHVRYTTDSKNDIKYPQY